MAAEAVCHKVKQKYLKVVQIYETKNVLVIICMTFNSAYLSSTFIKIPSKYTIDKVVLTRVKR